jgi:hypothetical protein
MLGVPKKVLGLLIILEMDDFHFKRYRCVPKQAMGYLYLLEVVVK